MTRPRRQLGAPGIYDAVPAVVPALEREAMHVCAFVGVAPRGPAYPPVLEVDWAPRLPRPGERVRSLPVAVDSWADYQARFGGFEGPGRLPYAVASFFQNGGQRAYVVRVVATLDPTDPRDGVARGALQGVTTTSGGEVWLRARDEGQWGNRLGATLATVFRPVAFLPATTTAATVSLPLDTPLVAGDYLRCELPSGDRFVRRVARIREVWTPGTTARRAEAELASALSGPPVFVEVAQGILTVFEDEVERERFEALGFAHEHPRFLARVLAESSLLLYPAVHRELAGVWEDVRWLRSDLEVGLQGVEARIERLVGGADRYAEITPEDFFSDWLVNDEVPGDGVHALVELPDVGSIVTPDLYVPDALASQTYEVPESLAGPEFAPCRTPVGVIRYAAEDLELRSSRAVRPDNVVAQIAEGTPLTVVPDALDIFDAGGWLHVRGRAIDGALATGWTEKTRLADEGRYVTPPPALDGLRLDPNADLSTIIGLQVRLVNLAQQLRGPTVLLDVPPGLSSTRIERWRANFDSAFAAAYFPWVRLARADDERGEAIDLNPSAVAAGIIARKELGPGITHGPANELAADAVDVTTRLAEGSDDRLHPIGINLFTRDRDGIRLIGARTLSFDPAYRQLSVRRTMTMIQRALHRQMQWLVFEPNNESTWRDVRSVVTAFLRRLHRDRAFRGQTEREAFFVRCDGALNDTWRRDHGQLVAEVGVALAEPVEFLLLDIVRGADETVQVEARG